VFSPTSNPPFELDIVQDGTNVLAWDRGAGTLSRVDVTRPLALTTDQATVPSGDIVRLGASTATALDPKSGKLWLSDVSTAGGVAALDTTREPSVTVGTDAAVAVSPSGRVFAVSAEKGAVGTVAPIAGKLTFVESRQLGNGLADLSVAAVGEDAVVLDAAAGRVFLPEHDPVQLPEHDGAVLQQSGASAPAVLVATKTSLYSIGLADGAVRMLSKSGSGAPAQPVRFGDCIHAAWAGIASGAGVYARACGGTDAQVQSLGKSVALEQPVFRVNRAQLALNDTRSGAVWNVDLTPQRVDDWSAFKPKQSDTTEQQPGQHTSSPSSDDRQPVAVADETGARTGRTTTLYLLDNDQDPDQGDILAISALGKSDVSGVQPSIAPDGQSAQITLPEQLNTDAVHFDYTIDDGRGKTATAHVTVDVKGPQDESAPYWRKGWPKPHLARLRAKLEAADGPLPSSVRGVGYRLDEE